MGKIVEFPPMQEEELDLESMDREELLDCLDNLRSRIQELDDNEPLDMDSEEYELWGEEHEELEDLVDEILELLDELN